MIRRVLLAALCMGVAFAVPCAFAGDSAPDWLRALAREKLPDYPDNPIAVQLVNEVQTTVSGSGEIETRHRIAYKLLRPESRDEYGLAAVPFDNQTKITSFSAWTIAADGHEYALKDKDALETSLTTYEVFSDVKAKFLKYSAADPGNVVGYEFVQKQRPFVFEDDWEFQDKIPLRHGRLILQVPAGWEYTARWFNYPDQKPQVSGNQYTWEVTDVPAVDVEPEMPSRVAVAGWVGLKYFPTDPAMRARTTGTWNDLGLWYAGLTQPTRNASPEIKQKVAELTSNLSDPIAKIRALAEFAQQKIRYAAIEFGIGGYQPHLASDIFTHQYGDCKDKATLLITMLHEAGIEAYYVVVFDERGIVRPDYPSMHFNHAITAIKLPDSIDSSALYAVVNHPKLGRILFFDPTNEYVPLGYLPTYLQANYGLVVGPDGGTILQMPLLPPSTNRLLRTGKFTLTPTGDLWGDVQEVEWGGPAASRREDFLTAQPSKRAEILENFLGSFLTNYTLTGASVGNLDKYGESLVVSYKFASPGYATNAGGMLFLRPRIVGDKYTNYLTLFANGKPRKYPVEFDEATRQDDVFDIALPAGYVVEGLPQPVQAQCDYATYKSETEFADGILHYKRTFEIKDVIVPTDKLPVIRDFLQKVAADQQSAAVLRRVASATN